MGSLVIRDAAFDDAAAIATLLIESWRATYFDGMVEQHVLDSLSLPEETARWQSTIQHGFATLVAEAHDGICGVVAVAAPSRDEDEAEGVAELTSVYVDKSSLRGGVGSELMASALMRVSGGFWSELTVWTLEKNVRALAFYESFGFKRDGAARTDDYWLMADVRLRRPLT